MSREQPIFLALALASTAAFVAGLALLGVSKAAGYFYIASLLIGAPVLLRIDLSSARLSKPLMIYVALLAGFAALCVGQIWIGEVELSLLDYISRQWIGVINGFFFLALFRFRREWLLVFLGVVAAAHGLTAIVAALWEGFDPSILWLSRGRVGGVTNPIPYSNMLLTSVGLAAIVAASRVRRDAMAPNLALTALLFVAGMFGVLLTGTRGTLLAVPFLVILIALVYRERLGGRILLRAMVAFLLLGLATVFFVLWTREVDVLRLLLHGGSDEIRIQLFQLSGLLFLDAPILGHGLGSVPRAFVEMGFDARRHAELFIFNHMHNQYLDLLVKTGLLGTMLFFGPILVALVAALQMMRKPAERVYALAILWVGGSYCLYGLTTSFFAHANTMLQLGVYLGMAIWLVPEWRADKDTGS